MIFPMAFLIIGLVFLIVSEHEFQRRAERDNAEFRQDLAEAGVMRSQIAALLTAQTKLQTNASSYAQIIGFIDMIFPIFMAIPLYLRIKSAAK